MSRKIYTKKGDKGYTSVLGTRERFLKCNIIPEAVGTVDELNSHIGLIRSFSEIGIHSLVLEQIQDDLFVMGAELANVLAGTSVDLNVSYLEDMMDQMSQSLEPLKNFILPAGTTLLCHVHVARSVCRRAERKIVELNLIHEVDPILMEYINRLSDYLFILARKLGEELQIPETIWKK